MNPGPPPRPVRGTPARGTLIGALCGPLLLITLGALLVIDHAGEASFTRTWPVLLIVFGICKMLQHLGAKAI